MLPKEFERTLDVKDRIRVRTITVVQGDLDSNIIYLNLKNGGKKYDLTDTKVEIVFAKPDGTTVLQSDIDIIDAKEGVIKCVLRTNTIAVAGVVNAEVKVRSKDNDKLLTSRRFVINVVETLLTDDAVESTDDFDILTELIKEVEVLIREVEEANVSEIITLKEELQILQTQLEQKQQDLIDLENEVEGKEVIRDEQYLELQRLGKELLDLKIELLNLKDILKDSIPFVNDKGNWQVGEEDTGVKAQGPKGDKGETGGVNSVNELKGDVILTGSNIKIDDKTISEEISDIKLTNKAEQERLDNLSKVVVESGNSMSQSLSDLEKMKWGKDELELGGRNLIHYANNVEQGAFIENREVGTPYEQTLYHVATRIRLKEPIKINGISTMSIHNSDYMYCFMLYDDNLLYLGQKDGFVTWRKEPITIQHTGYIEIAIKKTDNSDIELSELEFSLVKLEKGNIATDWTPAPEDLDGIQTQPAPVANMNHIEYLENQIKELREMIALRG